MNPGYLAFILIVILFILLASGWKQTILQDIPHGKIVLFFVFWFLGCWYTWDGYGLSIHMAVVSQWMLVLGLLWGSRTIWRSIPWLLVSCLLAAFYFLFQEIYRANPVLTLISLEFDLALSLGLLAIAMSRHLKMQMLILTAALLMGDTYLALRHRHSMPVSIGGLRFQDVWWLTLFTARFGTLMLQGMMIAGRKTAAAWSKRQASWRNKR